MQIEEKQHQEKVRIPTPVDIEKGLNKSGSSEHLSRRRLSSMLVSDNRTKSVRTHRPEQRSLNGTQANPPGYNLTMDDVVKRSISSKS